MSASSVPRSTLLPSGDLSAEPSLLGSLTAAQKERLTDLLDRYLSALEEGLPLSADALIAENPDLAGPLANYLGSLHQLHGATFGLEHVSPPSRSVKLAEGDERCLGDFVLVREVGRGGMGVVYEARQLSLDRRVALKVLPFAAVMDSKQIARFKIEAQAAAQLHHPNIVPVFAVGVERGVHYYAMQFIDGQPLDRAIAQLRQHRGERDSSQDTIAASATTISGDTPSPSDHACSSFLTDKLKSRRQYFDTVVRLGIQAADALHAAHGFGIVHRDIKPSNLLLDGEGKLWVTDFGLARCRSEMDLTQTGDVVGTRRYMSPEQAAGQIALVDQRADVYSLGVTLYELLTLEPAFGPDSPTQLHRDTFAEPLRLRHHQPLLPVDLETVVLKAMASVREERYLTAKEFADDLNRVLEGKPTIARPPTVADRLGKWARRHVRLVAATTALSLCAAISLTVATYLVSREKNRAENNSQRAELHFRQAHETVDRFGAELAQRLADVPGAEKIRQQLLIDTLHYYQDFASKAADDPALRADLATTHSKIGTLAEQTGSLNEALAAHQTALQLFERLVADEPKNLEYRRRVAVCQNNLGQVLARAGRSDDALQSHRAAIELQQQLAAEFPDNMQYQGDLARSHNNLGMLQSQIGAVTAAAEEYRQAIRLQQAVVDAAPSDPQALSSRAVYYNNLAGLQVDEFSGEAAKLYRLASADQTKAVQTRPSDLKFQSDLATTLNNLGAVESRMGQIEAAAKTFGYAIEIQQQLVRMAPLQKAYARDLAVSYNNLGLAKSKLRQSAEAEQSFRQALALQTQDIAQNQGDLELSSSLGGVWNNLGIVLEEMSRLEEAADSYRQAVTFQRAAFEGAKSVDRYRTFLSKHYYNYGRVLRRLSRADEAAEVALQRKKLWQNDPQRLFSVAEELSLASGQLVSQKPATMTAEACAEQAIATLGEAASAGYELKDDVLENEAFRPLRKNPRFMRLVKHEQ